MVELTEDVLLTILDCIENRSMLHPLLFVSRWFHTAVEPRLYSSIKTSNPVILRRRFDGLRRRIVSNQYLASSVRKLHVILGNAPGSPEQFSQLDDTLRYLVGLKDLKLNLYIPPGATLTTMTRVPCPFALTKFSWLNPMPDVEILRYLENQPSIEHLHVAYAPIGNINLAPGALPRLKQLVALSSMAMAILPGRKVNCLNINLGSPFPVHPSQAMEDALGHIQFLNCFTRKTTFILPGLCSMHNLRWLRLSFPLGIQQINLTLRALSEIIDGDTVMTRGYYSSFKHRTSDSDI